MTEGLVYVNGNFYEKNEAKVSAFDRGFLYGDGAFETFVVRKGKVFKADEHLDRLYRSLHTLRIKVPITEEGMKRILIETGRKNQLQDGFLRIVVSRGSSPWPLLDPRTTVTEPTIVIFVRDALPTGVTRELVKPQKEGIRMYTASVRKIPPICLESRVKSLNYLNSILARLEAIDKGMDESLLLDVHGFVTEGCGDNIFGVNGETLFTPTGLNILEGITRQTILDLARSEGFKTQERDLTLYDLYNADEVFLTSTIIGVLPVLELDGRAIGAGRPGPVVIKLREIYEALLENSGTSLYK